MRMHALRGRQAGGAIIFRRASLPIWSRGRSDADGTLDRAAGPRRPRGLAITHKEVLLSRILVAVDFGELTPRTIDYAVRLAGEDSQIDLLHVLVGRPSSAGVGFPAARELVDALGEQEAKWARGQLEEISKLMPESVRGELIMREGPAADVICELGSEGDYELIAVSTHGRSGLKHLLIGSVAERVVRLAKVPVVVVR